MMIRYGFIICFLLVCSAFSQKENDNTIQNNEEITEVENKIEPSSDCLILEDENSIICKFIVNRTSFEKNIIVQWINPAGEVSRQRNMSIPKNHSSIYDYRYLEGREKGNWLFKVILGKKEYVTKFELK